MLIYQIVQALSSQFLHNSNFGSNTSFYKATQQNRLSLLMTLRHLLLHCMNEEQRNSRAHVGDRNVELPQRTFSFRYRSIISAADLAGSRSRTLFMLMASTGQCVEHRQHPMHWDSCTCILESEAFALTPGISVMAPVGQISWHFRHRIHSP